MYNRISRLYSKRNHIDCYNIQESIGFFRSARKSLLSKLASLLLNVLCLAFCWVIRPFTTICGAHTDVSHQNTCVSTVLS